MNKLVLLFLAVIGLNSCTGGQSQMPKLLSADEFSQQIKETETAVILDVRTPGEFEKGHLENARNIDWKGSDFDSKVANLERTTPLFVYCLSGGRSKAAVDHLTEIGFENITELSGGIMAWRGENLPEVAPDNTAGGMHVAQYETYLDSDKQVLVDFYADWCEPCKKMEPYLKKIANEMSDQVTLVRIDADANPQLCKDLGVSVLPVLKLYDQQKLTWEHEGYIDEQTVRNQLD